MLSKITKFNGYNFQERKTDITLLLVLRDLWTYIDQDRPPAAQAEEVKTWRGAHEHILALIKLSWEPDQRHMIADAITITEAGKR